MSWQQRALWWAKDYLTATRHLLGGLVSRADPDAYRSGSGRPCLVIPGVYETWHFLQPIVEGLHGRGHPVFVVTALGHNRHPVEASAELVARFVVEHELDEVFVAAHSKGGLIGKYAMLRLDPEGRITRMVAIATPFSGSRYADWAPNRTLRAFRASDPVTAALAAEERVNHRITSVFGAFDPIIPESSVLPGARNIELATGGHFQILDHPRTLEIVLAEAAAPPPLP